MCNVTNVLVSYIFLSIQYYECPYLLCVDHAMQAVVVCVRGTLSFKASIYLAVSQQFVTVS